MSTESVDTSSTESVDSTEESENDKGQIQREKTDDSIQGITEENVAFLKNEGIEIVTFMAKGGFAEVYKAKMKDKLYAVKQIKIKQDDKEMQMKEIENEKKIAKALKHKNIIRNHKIIEKGDKFIYFVSDFADGGDLITVLEDIEAKGGNLEEHLVRKWFLEVVEGISYMNKKGYAHRDIKADNVLLRRDNPKVNQFVAKVTDFGFSQHAKDSKKNVIMVTNYLGTLEYTSPENLICKINEGKPFDPFISDVFSLGVLLYVMVVLKFPFKNSKNKRPTTDREIRNHHKKMMDKKWKKLKRITEDENLLDLLEKLLEPEPRDRLDTFKIKEHKWSKDEASESSEDSDATAN